MIYMTGFLGLKLSKDKANNDKKIHIIFIFELMENNRFKTAKPVRLELF